MKGDHVVLVLVSCTLCISVPASAAPPHQNPINTAIKTQQVNKTLSDNTETEKSKPDRVFTQNKNDEPVRRQKDDYGKIKSDDTPDHEQQQSRTGPKLHNPGQDEKQPGADPNVDGNPGQDEQQPGADPNVDGNPGQDEKHPGADPKMDDNPGQDEQQPEADLNVNGNPGQDEQQPRTDPNVNGNPGQDEKQPKADPNVDGNPGQDEKQLKADPNVDGNPGQDEKQPKADPDVDGNPGQDEKQPKADPKGDDKPGQDEQQPRVDPQFADTSGQTAQSRHDQKLHSSPSHNHEISMANSDYNEASDQGIIPSRNDQEKKKSEAKSQDFENLIPEDADDNTEDTQEPGDAEVKEDPDTSNTALASVKEDDSSNTSRGNSVQNSDVKDREKPGDVQRKEPDNRELHPISLSSGSSNSPVASLPTRKSQVFQEPNKSTPGSEQVSSSIKKTTTVSSLPIVQEIAKPDDYLTVEDKMVKASDSQSENDSPYDYNIIDPHEEEGFEVKPAGNEEATPQVNNGGKFRDDEDSHFFAYFLTIMVTAIIFYLVFHNKQRIIALIIEGRAPRSGRTRRSSSRAKYHKLDNNLEEAITATKGSKYDRMY